MNGTIYCIGAGGTGSWLVPLLCKLVDPRQVTVFDGDTLELKNLDRQFFSPKQIGQKKASALAGLYGCQAVDEYYTLQSVEHLNIDTLLVCVDNDPARMAVLQACDIYECDCIIAANETHSASAHYYHPSWVESEFDPRIRSPEMVNNHANDPRAAAIGCTGEAQKGNPQLASANFTAAALAANLFNLWKFEAPKVSEEVRRRLPYLLISNLTKLETHRLNEKA